MPKKDYTPMWKGLGVDVEAHDGLLEVLTRAAFDRIVGAGGALFFRLVRSISAVECEGTCGDIAGSRNE